MVLQRGARESWELESEGPTHRLLSAGCLFLGLGGALGLGALGLWLDGHPVDDLGGAAVSLLALAAMAVVSSLFLRETFVFSGEGVRRRRGQREELLARHEDIRGLALEACDRPPRRWRLLLVLQSGRSLPLSGYTESRTNVSELGASLARILFVPLRLPEDGD